MAHGFAIRPDPGAELFDQDLKPSNQTRHLIEAFQILPFDRGHKAPRHLS